MIRLLVVLLMSTLPWSESLAHQLSTAYLTIEQKQQRLSTELQVRWYDLNQAIPLDQDSDGQLRWAEVLQSSEDIEWYLDNRLSFSSGDVPCETTISKQWKTAEHFNEGYLVAQLTTDCPSDDGLLISYQLLFDQDTEHKVLLQHQTANGSTSGLLTAAQPNLKLMDAYQRPWEQRLAFWWQGVWHIWIGFDHILFLLALLLPAALVYQQGIWHAQPSATRVFKKTAWLITAFTLAHSITLTFGAIGWVPIDTSWVELVIALSVLFAALNNVLPMIHRLTWLTFAFGLVHGLGFASVLGQLSDNREQSVWQILAFNLGVETGQLAILFVLMPVLYWLSKRHWYRSGGMQLCSALIGIMAVHWSLERM